MESEGREGRRRARFWCPAIPARRSGLDTMSQLTFQRDTDLPARLRIYRRRIAVLRDYSARGKEQERELSAHLQF